MGVPAERGLNLGEDELTLEMLAEIRSGYKQTTHILEIFLYLEIITGHRCRINSYTVLSVFLCLSVLLSIYLSFPS